MANSARIDELRKKFDENPRRYFAPLANEYRKLGDLEQAIFICQEYLPQQPGHMSGHIVYGQALFESGRIDEARGVFETALTLDPENLIALRHLGDISAAGGDIDGARGWYRRVLEVDPRNDEIAALIAGLDGAPIAGAGHASAASATDRSNGDGHDGSPDLQPIAEAPPATPLEVANAASSNEPLDLNTPAVATPSHSSLAVPTSHPGTDRRYAEPASTPDAFGAIDFDVAGSSDAAEIQREGDLSADFSGLETTDLNTGHVELPSGETDVLDAAIEGLELSEPTPWSRAGTPAATEGLGDSMAEFTVLGEGEAPTELAGGTDAAPTAESPVADVTNRDLVAHDDVGTPPAAPAVPFVTETMAELYLQQGHLESALGIFTTLLEQRPGDARLAARRQSVADALYGARPSDRPTDPTARKRPTIREFLAELLGVRVAKRSTAGGRESGGEGSGRDRAAEPVEQRDSGFDAALDGEAAEDDRTAGAADQDAPVASRQHEDERSPVSLAGLPVLPIDSDLPPLDDADESQRAAEALPSGDFVASPAERSNRPTPSASSDSLSGSIDSLFSGGKAAQSDVAAAAVLADAFDVEKRDEPLLAGAPARRATDELSLDHVFRAGMPPQDSDGADAAASFSFDQFFADESNDARPSQPADAPSASRSSSEDIAQFNAWLSGLKKT